ncbi:MAG: AAA-like domain-containing protein [Desulfococcaceae bacterium]
MRTFSSYGPVDGDLHYHAPRTELIEKGYRQITGENPEKGGHYITVWAPRQAGKTWIMQQVVQKIRQQGDFEVAIISMQSGKTVTDDQDILNLFTGKLGQWFRKKMGNINTWKELENLFIPPNFEKPLILIIDEFDAMREDFINRFANEFREMYIRRQNEADKVSGEKSCLLHGLALIGVRSVLGIENITGSPFNVQRSLHIPNLTFEEVLGMFAWYEKESGQKMEAEVTERLFYETQGQPGLTCWLGELLTETYNEDKDSPITAEHFEDVFRMAVHALPNNNILNIISKAKQEPYKEVILNLFRTDEKQMFAFDDSHMNFLFMNGVISTEKSGSCLWVKFPSPFVQKRLFNYFARELFAETGKLHEPFEDLTDTLTENSLHIRNLMRRFEIHLKKNREWMLRDAPRRKDLRIFEAVFHFALYRYLSDFLGMKRAQVWPEFPTGNGKIDILIRYADRMYAVELKTYTDEHGYKEAVAQAARYGKQLGLAEISLVFFVEYIDDANREKYEKDYEDAESVVRVETVFVATGE